MNIQIAETRQEIEFCKRALMEFRANLNPDIFVEQVLRMRMEGFHLIYIANENNTEATAIAGFRIFEMLRTGTMIYIDDLFTFEKSRGRGYAKALLDYIGQFARTLNIETVHLDSGFDLHPAHRLYLKSGYSLACHHLRKSIAKLKWRLMNIVSILIYIIRRLRSQLFKCYLQKIWYQKGMCM